MPFAYSSGIRKFINQPLKLQSTDYAALMDVLKIIQPIHLTPLVLSLLPYFKSEMVLDGVFALFFLCLII